MLTKEIIQKLATLEKPVLTFHGEDGYPISVPVDYEVVEFNGKHTIKILNLPKIAQVVTADKKVSLLFNKVDELEQGGYGNRRYVQIYGYIKEGIVDIKEVKGWDENELDFLSLVQRAIPRGKKYLKDYNERLFHATLASNDTARLITSVDGIVQLREIQYIMDDDMNLYFLGQFPEPSIRQLDVNPNVKLLLTPPSEFGGIREVEVDARASFVKDKEQKEALIAKLAEKDPAVYTIVHQLAQTTRIVKLVPYRMKYGARTELETHEVLEKKPTLGGQIKQAIGTRIKYWLFASRAPFFTASAIPVIVGSVAAFYATHAFNWGIFLWTFLGILLIHAGANIINDYYDHTSSNDEYNILGSPFNGGSRFIQSGLASPAKILISGTLLLLAGGVIGLYLDTIYPGHTILIIGLIGGFLAFFYTAPPFRFAYHGLGDIVIAITFGPLPVLGAFYLQTGTLSFELSKYAWAASVPIGVLVALILYVNSFQDMDADELAGKRTSIVRLGKKTASKLYPWLLGFVYAWIVIMVALSVLPWAVLLAFATLPLAIKASKGIQNLYAKIYDLLPVNVTTIGIHFLVGILMAVGFVIGSYI